MEAGTAPAAAEGQPTEGQTEGVEQTQTPDIAGWQQSVDQQLSQAADGVRQLTDLVQSRLPEPQAEPEPDFAEQWSSLFGDDAYGTGGPDPAQLQELVNQQAQKIAQQAIAPIQQQMQAFQQQMTAQELGALQSEFPELADPKATDHLADQVFNAATQILPPGAPEELLDGLMQNAKFVRYVHLAEKAMSRAQQETPAGGTQPIPQVETGGGAAPGSTPEGDEWDQFMQSRQPNGPVW